MTQLNKIPIFSLRNPVSKNLPIHLAMNNLILVEIIISLAFVYFIISTAISGMAETINKWMKTRGRFLKDSLEKVMNDPRNKNWADLVYTHPLVDSLKKNAKTPPSYISAETFSKALIDVLSEQGMKREVAYLQDGSVKVEESYDTNDLLVNFRIGLKSLKNSKFKAMMTSLVRYDDSIEKVSASIAAWYESYMDRTTGWFKWKMKRIVLYLAIPVTLLFNIDTVHVFKTLWNNNEVRAVLVSGAEKAVQESRPVLPPGIYDTVATSQDSLYMDYLKSLQQSLDTISGFLTAYNIPFGWPSKAALGEKCVKPAPPEGLSDTREKGPGFWCYLKALLRSITFVQVVGWLLTIMALSLGAPFWFDVMKKFVNIRNTGIKPEEKKKTAST